MRYTILLDKNEKTRLVEAQEQSRFLKAMLESLDVPIEFNPEEPLTVESKLQLRKSFSTYNIHVIDDMSGGIKMFANNELIGEWFKCKYTLKEDLSQIDPNKKHYLEMNVNFWSIFEKNE